MTLVTIPHIALLYSVNGDICFKYHRKFLISSLSLETLASITWGRGSNKYGGRGIQKLTRARGEGVYFALNRTLSSQKIQDILVGVFLKIIPKYICMTEYPRFNRTNFIKISKELCSLKFQNW